MSLTDHLLDLANADEPSYAAAVAHPFLTAAGELSLPAARLAFYLSQDRIYAGQAYPRFIAQLISKIPLDDPVTAPLSTRTLTLLVGCLTNIVREVEFFDTTARNYNLPLDHGYWRDRKATRDYTAEMARIGTFGSLEDGLVFLYAMEKVYLDAWSAVYHALPQSVPPDLTAKAIRDLSYNWSNANPDFVQFVDHIGHLVNDYFAPAMAGHSVAGRSAPEALARARALWSRVVELEVEFWPNEGDEDSFRASECV